MLEKAAGGRTRPWCLLFQTDMISVLNEDTIYRCFGIITINFVHNQQIMFFYRLWTYNWQLGCFFLNKRMFSVNKKDKINNIWILILTTLNKFQCSIAFKAITTFSHASKANSHQLLKVLQFCNFSNLLTYFLIKHFHIY